MIPTLTNLLQSKDIIKVNKLYNSNAFSNPNNFNPPGIECERLSDTTVNNYLVEGCTVNSIGTWQNAGTLTSEGNTHSGSKAINAGVETNNEIGRHA